MRYEADTADGYIDLLEGDRKEAVARLRKIARENLPEGFEEIMQSNMISYVVPHSLYPPGYYVNPKDPLPFMAVASRKNHIAVYHMGIYMVPELLQWFQEEYAKVARNKLDMGKSCIRFKKAGAIPYELLAELFRKITVQDYINKYEEAVKTFHSR